MSEEEKKGTICEVACACLHAVLIAGSEDCMLNPDNEYAEMDFWEDDLEDNDEYVNVLGTTEIDGRKFTHNDGLQTQYLQGTFFRVLAVIGNQFIEDMDKVFRELGHWIMTDGRTHYAGKGTEAYYHSGCPIHLDSLKLPTPNGYKDFTKYREARNDNYETINMRTIRYCDNCGTSYDQESGAYIDCEDSHICDSCLDNYLYCENCEEYYPSDKTVYVEDSGITLCEDCVEHDNYFYCEECECWYHVDSCDVIDTVPLCVQCRDEVAYYCEESGCGKYHFEENMINIDGWLYCEECATKVFTKILKEAGLFRWKI
ncbi:MAG: hypothetical protein GY853_16600 [PVC group bacterium]|nr:hypothetical protein [PVC group bacterium]